MFSKRPLTISVRKLRRVKEGRNERSNGIFFPLFLVINTAISLRMEITCMRSAVSWLAGWHAVY